MLLALFILAASAATLYALHRSGARNLAQIRSDAILDLRISDAIDNPPQSALALFYHLEDLA